MIESHECTAKNLTLAEWVHKNNANREFENHAGKSKTGWRNDNNKKLIMEKAADDHCKHVKCSTSGNKHRKLPHHLSEVEILKKVC